MTSPPEERPDERAEQRARLRRRLWTAAQVLGTLGAFGVLFWIVPVRQVTAAFGRASPAGFLLAMAFAFGNLCLSTARWRVLLSAYGAPRIPSYGRLLKLNLIGMFYNNVLPGGVGGDVVRGVGSREAFGADGATGALAVVFVERVLGLAGLLAITSIAFALHPLEGVQGVPLMCGLGLTAAAGAVTAIAIGRRVGPRLPGALGRIASSLPEIQRALAFFFAWVLSLGTQSVVALQGHCIVASIAPHVTLADSFVIVPLAGAASFFPLTVAGAGAREGAFVALASAVDMARADATAVSLLWFASSLLVSCAGGVLLLISPVARTPAEVR